MWSPRKFNLISTLARDWQVSRLNADAQTAPLLALLLFRLSKTSMRYSTLSKHAKCAYRLGSFLFRAAIVVIFPTVYFIAQSTSRLALTGESELLIFQVLGHLALDRYETAGRNGWLFAGYSHR